MAVSNPCLLLSILHAGAQSCSDELFRMISYAVIHLIHHLEMTISASPYVAQFTYGHISRFACRYLGEAEFQHSGQYLHF